MAASSPYRAKLQKGHKGQESPLQKVTVAAAADAPPGNGTATRHTAVTVCKHSPVQHQRRATRERHLNDEADHTLQ